MSVRAVAVACLATLFLLPGLPAQTVTATTLPLKDKGAYAWFFFDSVVVGIDLGGLITKDARINAYSLTQPRLLWRQQDIAATHRLYEDDQPWTPDFAEDVLYIGNGPFTVLDVRTGAVRWQKSCDEAGFITREVTQPIGANKLLMAGSEKCKTHGGGDLKGNMQQEKRLMLVNRATGQTLWTHNAKGRNWSAGKLQARLFGGTYREGVDYSVLPLAPAGPAGFHPSTGDDVDRVLVAGERLEAVSFADGHLLWRSADEVGSPAGSGDHYMFFVKDDKLSAYDVAGTGTPAWSVAIDASEAAVYVLEAADSQAAGPSGAGDLLVETDKAVFRLAPTGKQKWTINRQGAGWEWLTASGLLFVESDDKVGAYDLATGASRWELKVGKRLVDTARVTSGGKTIGLFVERGDWDKDAGRWKGPYRFWGVDLATGAVQWSAADVDGNKIVLFGLWDDGKVLRIWGEKTGKCASLDIADGHALAASTRDADQLSLVYLRDSKTLVAQTGSGDIVWSRQGEATDQEFRFQRERGIVIWPLKHGTVEVIRLADGTSLWKGDVGSDPVLHMDRSGHHIVVQRGDKVTLLEVTP